LVDTSHEGKITSLELVSASSSTLGEELAQGIARRARDDPRLVVKTATKRGTLPVIASSQHLRDLWP
jgi:hypothetical protein